MKTPKAPAGAKAFFAYARKRHEITIAKDFEQLRPPWTTDPILSEYRFCSVFRELDKNTVWYRQNVRERYDGTPAVLLATVLFRMINRIETCDVIFNQTVNGVTTFDRLAGAHTNGQVAKTLDMMLRLVLKERPSGPYVTGAYTMSSPPGYTKLPGMFEIVRRFATEQKEWKGLGAGIYSTMHWYDHGGDETGAAELMACNNGEDWLTLESCWSWLRQFDFLGDFHSYEIVTDLRHTYLLNRAPDILTWANPGPGANRGANRVWGRELNLRNSKVQLNDEMRQLLALSRDAMYWPQVGKMTAQAARNAKLWPKWEMRDVEHTLCEFDKFERVRLGQGRPRSKYRPGAA